MGIICLGKNPAVASETAATSVAVIVLLVIAVGLVGLMVVWRLSRGWRRRVREDPRRGARGNRSDIWQASGDRLVSKLESPEGDDRRGRKGGGHE